MVRYNHFTDSGGPYIERDKSKIAILPVSYDKTSTWIKGADKGPFAILEASQALELYDIETDSEVYKNGIYTAKPLTTNTLPDEMVRQVEARTLELLDEDKFVVLLGGEHSISTGSVKAHALKYEHISVLQLDAHLDLREEYEGSRYNHACTMARISEICPIVQVGIRSMDISEKNKTRREDVFFAEDIAGDDGWMDEAARKLTQNVYVTIDLDVFDPGIMSSTGTPEPGGLDWYTVTRFLKRVSEKRKVVGFDVVELCPNRTNKAPDYLAAKLVYKFLSYVFNSSLRGGQRPTKQSQ